MLFDRRYFLGISHVFCLTYFAVLPASVYGASGLNSTVFTTKGMAFLQATPPATVPAGTAESGPSLPSSSSVSAAVSSAATPTPVALKISAEPSVLFPGQEYAMVLSVPAESCAGGIQPFAGATVRSSSKQDLDLGILGKMKGDDCKATLPVNVSKDAVEGELILLFDKLKADAKEATVSLGSVRVKVKTSVGPGPIPPGLAPSLDLMWKVLPRRTVADNYGSRVADRFFAVEAVLGNETGYDLQLSALGFEVPYVHCTAILTKQDFENTAWDLCRQHSRVPDAWKLDYPFLGNLKSTDKLPKNDKAPKPFSVTMDRPRTKETPPLPIDAYPIVRGTVEREQSVGTRAIIVNLVKGAGSVMVGVGGFFPDDGNFVRSNGLVTGPVEKALELVYPDLTTNHLINLDSRTLRDGVVVPNNTSYRINAFISREVVQCAYPHSILGLFSRSGGRYKCRTDDARMPWIRDFDPNQVMARLGEMVLTGRKIQYLERVRVLTAKDKDKLPRSEGGPVLFRSSLTLDHTAAQQFTVPGTNLEGASIVAVTQGIKVVSQDVAADKHSINFTINSSAALPGITYELQAVSNYGNYMLYGTLAPAPNP